MQVINHHDGKWIVNYIPNEVGETYFDIFVANELVPGCPYKVNIFDVHKIHIANLKDNGLLGRLFQFNIDATHAGTGQLDIVIQDGRIPCDAIPHGSYQFDASFMPHEPGRHTIDVKFNGLPVLGKCHLIDQMQ
jgi:filamin